MADDSDVESSGYVKGALCKIHPQEEFSSLGSLSMGSDIYAEDQLQSPPPYETQNVFLPSAIKSDINEKGEVENRDFSEKPNENKTKRKFSWTPSIQPAKSFRQLSKKLVRTLRSTDWSGQKWRAGSSKFKGNTDTLFPLHPHGLLRKIWDSLILIFVLYNSVFVPYELGFEDEKEDFAVLDHIIDVFFLLDIILNFRTGFIDDGGRYVDDFKQITWKYLNGWFWIDLLATIPFEWGAQAFGAGTDTNFQLLGFLKTPRLLRLGRLMRFLEKLKSANLIKILRLVMFMLLVAHWIACGWNLQASYVSPAETWRDNIDERVNGERVSLYLISLYTAFLMLVGENVDPVNNTELVYCSIVVLLGGLTQAVVVGNMALLVTNFNITQSRHNEKNDLMKETVRYLGLPPELNKRIQEYFEYISIYSHPGVEGMQILQDLPTSLMQDVLEHMHKKIIERVPFFKDCEKQFIMALIFKLRPVIFMPYEIVFRMGDVSTEMYFLTRGRVQVLGANDVVIRELDEGSFFGEIAMVACVRRTATVKTLTSCDLNVLSARDMAEVLEHFPKSLANFEKIAYERLLNSTNEESTDHSKVEAFLNRKQDNSVDEIKVRHSSVAEFPGKAAATKVDLLEMELTAKFEHQARILDAILEAIQK